MNIKWIIRTTDFKKADLQAQVIQCPRPKVMTKAIKTLLTFWGFALLCVFIPVAHFVLVPTLLATGIFFAYKTLGFKNNITSGTYNCPSCNEVNLLKNQWFADELRTRCEKCAIQLVIQKV